jgi:hypothetical protein
MLCSSRSGGVIWESLPCRGGETEGVVLSATIVVKQKKLVANGLVRDRLHRRTGLRRPSNKG